MVRSLVWLRILLWMESLAQSWYYSRWHSPWYYGGWYDPWYYGYGSYYGYGGYYGYYGYGGGYSRFL